MGTGVLSVGEQGSPTGCQMAQHGYCRLRGLRLQLVLFAPLVDPSRSLTNLRQMMRWLPWP